MHAISRAVNANEGEEHFEIIARQVPALRNPNRLPFLPA